MLGKGSFGKVFMLESLDPEDGPSNQVLKSIPKADIDMHGLKGLKVELVVMQLLSSEKWRHPNIAQIYDVHHSWTHIFLQMEYGGSIDLHERLRICDSGGKGGMKQQPLSLQKAISIAAQCTSALEHMHNGPMIAHRDIKPANIIVLETETDVKIKIVDFGLAKVVNISSQYRDICGTLPFMAPETILEPHHDVFAADIWSMGIVLLDVFCRVGFIERMFKCRYHAEKAEDKEMAKVNMMERLRVYFGQPDGIHGLLVKHLRDELQSLLCGATVLLNGMLDVSASSRWSASKVIEGFKMVMLLGGTPTDTVF